MELTWLAGALARRKIEWADTPIERGAGRTHAADSAGTMAIQKIKSVNSWSLERRWEISRYCALGCAVGEGQRRGGQACRPFQKAGRSRRGAPRSRPRQTTRAAGIPASRDMPAVENDMYEDILHSSQ